MMWLTWRQFRTQAIATTAGLVLVAIVLAVTGVQLCTSFRRDRHHRLPPAHFAASRSRTLSCSG